VLPRTLAMILAFMEPYCDRAPYALPNHPSSDSYLYGPPVAPPPPLIKPQPQGDAPYTVPLTAPGMPQFPDNRR
jgi:hypothetical protein